MPPKARRFERPIVALPDPPVPAAPEATRLDMMIIAFLGQKGGSGKTTLALGTADIARAEGLEVSVIDLDPQRSAEQWSDLRQALTGNDDLVAVHGTTTSLDKMLAASRATATDLVVIDSPGQLDKAMVYAAAAAHLAVVPTRSGILDQFALRETLDYLKRIGALPRTVVVLNAPSRDAPARDEIERLAREFGVPVLPIVIEDDPDFAAALRQGRSVVESAPRRKAAKAMRALYDHLIAAARPHVPARVEASH